MYLRQQWLTIFHWLYVSYGGVAIFHILSMPHAVEEGEVRLVFLCGSVGNQRFELTRALFEVEVVDLPLLVVLHSHTRIV